jgi:hypothetical protein
MTNFIAVLTLASCIFLLQSCMTARDSSTTKDTGDILSMQANTDGTYSVICKDGKRETATTDQIKTGQVCVPCSDLNAPIGTKCADGSIFAGVEKYGRLYAQPCDVGQTLGGDGACQGTRSKLKWDSSYVNGCAKGWRWPKWSYDPAEDHLGLLHKNRVAIGNFTNGDYWSSTERGKLYAWSLSFPGGYPSNVGKKDIDTFFVRCVQNR